jgi:hypothetical protein
MITFFSILFVLLGINILLLIFSLNGASKNAKKTFQNISSSSIPKLYPEQYSETEYKKAV